MTTPNLRRNLRTLIIREEILRVSGLCYIEALLLEMFLGGEFDEPTTITVAGLAERILLPVLSGCKISNPLKRLVDKGFVKNVSAPQKSPYKPNTVKTWVVQRDVVDKAIKRLVLDNPEY